MTTAATLVQRTRRYLRDWPEGDSLTASMASSGTSMTVADATVYGVGTLVQVDQEAMQVRAASGVTVTVLRAARGSTAATHTSGSTILMRPRYLDVDILDSINAGIDAVYPLIYRPVANEYAGVADMVYEYDLPIDLSLGTPLQYISDVQFKVSGDLTFRRVRVPWNIIRGAPPVIKFKQSLPAGTLRITGMGPFVHLADVTASLDAYFPLNAEDLLVEYAAQKLLMSGEAARAREDTGARDMRENANKPGVSEAAANAMLSRWQLRLHATAMPPLGPHMVSVL